MRAVVQRVSSASVVINSDEKRSIGRGLVVLLGVGADDAAADIRWMLRKIVDMRIFPDEAGKFDRSVMDIKGALLIISQFTLYGDCRTGRRPDFTAAARPDHAIPLYEEFVRLAGETGLVVQTGAFAADMLVDIQNDGPVTISLDSKEQP